MRNPAKDFPGVCVGGSADGIVDFVLSLENIVHEIVRIAQADEATQLYMQLADSTDNKLAVEALKDIADEELVHAGEFLRLLRELAPDEEKLYDKGAKEVEEEIKKMKLHLH